MIPCVRPISVALVCLVTVVGCQSASLQDAAPTAVPVARPDNGGVQAVAPETEKVIRRNPGIGSVVPIEKTSPVEDKEFVASGASRTGQYPNFNQQPKAANAQFSDQQKQAAEEEIAELLRNRASTPDARARYEARLRRLRAVAANHGSEMQQEIEN